MGPLERKFFADNSNIMRAYQKAEDELRKAFDAALEDALLYGTGEHRKCEHVNCSCHSVPKDASITGRPRLLDRNGRLIKEV